MNIEPVSMTKKDFVFAIAMLVCGFLYWNLIIFTSLGAGTTIFAAVFCIAAGIYLKPDAVKQSKRSMLCLIVLGLSAVNFSLFDNGIIKGLNLVFLSGCAVYWICLLTGNDLDKKLSAGFIGDLINQFLLVPFHNFACLFIGVRVGAIKNKNGKHILYALIGILVFLPVLAFVINRLVVADAAFESLIGSIDLSFSANALKYLFEIVLGIPVACYLYGLIYGNRYKRHIGHITMESLEKNMTAFRFAPGIAVYSALSALNVIYVVFFLAQLTYLFSAFGGNIPGAMTYAEYARRGFFELCTVAGINLAVITVAHFIIKQEAGKSDGKDQETKQKAPKTLRAEFAVLCLFTMMLIATAVSKMAMYISYYGLTQLRVYTAWFMLLLFIVFIVVGLRQFKNFNGARIIIISFVIFFLALSYGNADGMIAKYNISRYSEGTLKTLDINALSTLSDGAVPYLFELYNDTEDIQIKGMLRTAILSEKKDGTKEEKDTSTFRDFNLQRYNADKIRAAI